MSHGRLTAALLVLAGAAAMLGADVITDPGRSATGPATGAAVPWSGDPPSAAEFPIHDDVVDDDQVLAAIKKGVDYLLKQRHGDNFENGSYAAGGATNVGGETAVVVYALLHVEESVADEDLRRELNFKSPDLAPVIEYLKTVQPDGTYTAGFLASALTLLPKTKAITEALDRQNGAKAYLLRATNDNGGYEYTVPGAAMDRKVSDMEKGLADLRTKLHAPGKKTAGEVQGLQGQIKQAVADIAKERTAAAATRARLRKSWNPDGSNSQYGELGAWALADYGLPMPPGYWPAQDGYWRRMETPEGAFPYKKDDPKSLRDTMAAAGVASLFIAQEFLDTEPRLEPRKDKQLEAGLQFITDSFNGNSGDEYYHYAVERVGLASGLKFFGTHDWYRELARTLVKHQNGDGSWSANFYHGGGPALTIATSYALLTLARGRNPVLINKLSYSGPWNARSRDAARLAERLSKSFERPLNWQVVSDLIAPENWTDAPVLLITGSADPKFSPEVVEKLREYTEMGGIIFSTADGGKEEFTEAMKRYAAQILPGRQMRRLPAESPILNGELWAKVANPPELLALSNGIREVWIHSAADMGASWHKEDYEAKASWDIPGNLYFYATGKTNLKSRLQSTIVHAPDSVGGAVLRVGELLLGDNPNPEPGAWPRMAKLMRADCKTNVQVTTMSVADLASADPPPAAIHLTGTTGFTATDEEAAILGKYLGEGGMLLADSGGMSPVFSGSFEALVKKIYPKASLAPLRSSSAIYRGEYPNARAINGVRYRPYYSLKHGGPTEPEIEVIQPRRGGRYTVLFSRPDLTSGLLGTNTWGINGYTPESAEALARNMLEYVLANAPAGWTRPATQAGTQVGTQPGMQAGTPSADGGKGGGAK